MPQQPRITTIIVKQFEDITERIEEAFKDGFVTDDESEQIAALVRQGHQIAMEADEGVRLGVALIRGGTRSTHVRRYAADRDLVETLS